MLEKIISSKARLEVLNTLFSNQEKQLYPQEIITLTKLDPANVHKELDNLAESGLITVEKDGAKRFYSLNKASEYFEGFKKIFDEYRKIENLDKWFLMEEIPKANPSIAVTYSEYKHIHSFLSKNFGIQTKCQCIETWDKGTVYFYNVRREFKAFAQEVLTKLTSNYRWGLDMNVKVKRISDEWREISEEIYNTNLRNLTDKELFVLYERFLTKQRESHITGWPSNVVDFEESLFSKYLIKILNDKKEKYQLTYKVGEVFSILTTPTEESYAQKEYKDLIKLLEKIYEDEKLTRIFKTSDERIIENKLKTQFVEFYNLVDKHQKNFGWMSYQFEGPGWRNDYFIGILASLVRQNARPDEILRDLRVKEKATKAQQEKYITDYHLDKKEQGLFEVARGFVYMKGYRKDHMFYGMYCQEFLFREIARRTYLSLRQVRYIYPWEMKNVILKKKTDANELNARYVSHTFYSTKDGEGVASGEEGKKLLKNFNFVKEEIKEVSQLEGDTASPGKVRGEVVIVNTTEDMKNMKEGSVLVSIATSPDLVPAIKKARAIVTDMGGVTCHAAIISRELGIPCVIGTKIATKVLKNGDVVDVDATHARVMIIQKGK